MRLFGRTVISRRSPLLRFPVLVLVVALFATQIVGQTTTAQIVGSVKDEAGSVIAQAKITARNIETGFSVTGESDESGVYRVPNLPPGRYELKAEAASFASFVQTGLEFTIGQTAAIDITLKASLTESVTITDEAPIVERTKTESSEVVEGRRITDLPINGRQFIDFVLLTPSVVIGKAITGGALGPLQENVTKISFAGLSEQHSNFFAIDGADHTISLSGFQHLTPSQEAVQEFRILTNNYTADVGRALGGVVNIITKSGTNEYHGSVYYFFRNDALDAENVLSAPGLDVLRQHQFGVSVGGPITRDRTFFFVNYEGQLKEQSPTYTSFLLQTLPGVNAVKAFYGLTPEVLEQIRQEDYNQFLGRLDHAVNERNHFRARYNFVHQENENLAGAPGNTGGPSTFRDSPITDQSIVGSFLSIPSSRFTNDFLFQYSRRNFEFTNISGEPHLSIPNLLDVGRVIGPADAYIEDRIQIADSVTFQKGRHNFKFGGDYSHIRDNILWPLTVNGFLVYSPDSFFGAPPFGQPTPFIFFFGVPRALAGGPIPNRSTDFANVLFPSPAFEEAARIKYSHNTFDLFAQDDWRATDKLTINYGVRYFIESRGPFDIDEDYNNFGPRLGFAYAWNDKTVIRGGFGVFHSVLSWANIVAPDASYVGSGQTDLSRLLGPGFASEFSGPDPLGITLSPIPIPMFTVPAANNYIRNGVYPAGQPLITHNFNHAARDFPNPYSMQWSLQTEHGLTKDLAVSFSYLGVRALKMATTLQLNAQPIGRLPNGKTLFAPRSMQFGIVQVQIPGNTSTYHGGTVSLSKRFSNNFAVDANYTFSKAIDLVNSGSSQSFKDIADDSSNFKLNRGLSNQHVGQRFVLSAVTEAPQDTFLRNFRLSTIVTLESARYYTIFTGFDANGDLETGPDRVGSIGRNTYQGDPYYNVDLRLSRVVNFTEKLKGEFIAESFNLFNTVNVTDINTVYGAPDFVGPIPREFGDGIGAPAPFFGTPAQVSNQRLFQLAFKLTF